MGVRRRLTLTEALWPQLLRWALLDFWLARLTKPPCDPGPCRPESWLSWPLKCRECRQPIEEGGP